MPSSIRGCAMTDTAVSEKQVSGLRRLAIASRRHVSHRSFALGIFLVSVIALAALVFPWILNLEPNKMDFLHPLSPPSSSHWFGTDSFGRDIFARVVIGARTSLLVGVAVVVVNGIAGWLIGALAAYYRRLDNIIMRAMDGLMAFPAILLAISITATLGASIVNVIVALSITYVPRTARIVRSSILVLRSSEYVEAAKVSGASDIWILRKHLFPNSMTPLAVQLTFIFAYAIIAEAVLSYIGMGPPPPNPTWGNIISEGRVVLREAPWISVFPGLAIAMTVMGLNLIGDGLRDNLDPRLRVRDS